MNVEYLKTIKDVIAAKIGLGSDEVDVTSYIGDDLNIGELEFIEILGELEGIFQIDLVDEKENMESVADIVSTVSEKIG